jgi:hypothetical protein
VDQDLAVNIFPAKMLKKIQGYLYAEGLKKGKIIESGQIQKLIDDNTVAVVGTSEGKKYFTTDNIEAFSALDDYENQFGWRRDASSMTSENSIVSVSEGGRIQIKDVNDMSNDDRVISSYKDWLRWDKGHGRDFINSVFGYDQNDMNWDPEFKENFESKVKTSLERIGGIWVETRTDRIPVGARVRWKKGRGYWQQSRAQWNESTIDRVTPAGFYVTGKTDEFPKGKRFKPSAGTSMDVWTSFEGDIVLSGD